MTRPMRTSRQGLDLIKSFEGFRARSKALGDGRWIIGYGHTKTAREGLTLSEADAAKILQHYDLPAIEAALHRLVLAPINQNQFDALVSFAFNLGIETFRGCDVLAHVNAGEPLRAACAMGAWRRADLNGRIITVDALVRRRAMERALFLESPRGRPVAPSPMVRPLEDTGRDEPRLRDTPVTLDVSGGTPRMVAPKGTGVATGTTASSERTSEETARRIGERVTRILNESPGVPPDRDPARPSPTAPTSAAATRPPAEAPKAAAPTPPSADDITAAIAAIADPAPGPGPEPASVPASGEETGDAPDEALPPPPVPGQTGGQAAPRTSTLVIDDLEPIDPETLVGIDPDPVDWRGLAGFAIAGLVGLLTALWGFGQVSRVASGELAFNDEWQMLIGPFAVVLGTVLAALMVYSAVRLFLRR